MTAKAPYMPMTEPVAKIDAVKARQRLMVNMIKE